MPNSIEIEKKTEQHFDIGSRLSLAAFLGVEMVRLPTMMTELLSQ